MSVIWALGVAFNASLLTANALLAICGTIQKNDIWSFHVALSALNAFVVVAMVAAGAPK
jgi:hypothetical protein